MISPDMAEGFPGEIDLYVVYTLYEDNQLDIEFKATSTKDTYLNITNHTYFNLLGKNNQVLSHQLQIPATSYLKRHDNFDFIDVVPLNDAFDFTKDRTLGEAIKANMDQGFDDTLFIDSKKDLVLTEPTSPYQIKFKTTYPAVVIYTHNLKSQALIDDYPDGGLHSGIAIECQYALVASMSQRLRCLYLKKVRFITTKQPYHSKKKARFSVVLFDDKAVIFFTVLFCLRKNTWQVIPPKIVRQILPRVDKSFHYHQRLHLRLCHLQVKWHPLIQNKVYLVLFSYYSSIISFRYVNMCFAIN
jgi:hypothetical protein